MFRGSKAASAGICPALVLLVLWLAPLAADTQEYRAGKVYRVGLLGSAWTSSRAIGCLPALVGQLGIPGGGFGPRHRAVHHGEALADIMARDLLLDRKVEFYSERAAGWGLPPLPT